MKYTVQTKRSCSLLSDLCSLRFVKDWLIWVRTVISCVVQRRSVVGFSPRRLRFDPKSIREVLVVTKWQWNRFRSQYFGVFCHFNSTSAPYLQSFIDRRANGIGIL